jgi:hypothetical protein
VQHGKWPAGLEDVEEVFGIKVDFEEMARVKVQLVVGEKDTDGSALGKDDKAGTNRMERVRYLQGALEEIGVSSELTVVGGVGHDGVKCLHMVEGWLNNKFSENKV